MREITQQQIISIAPNASAVNNARKISNSSGFVSRSRSADDTFYMGECKGSGKSNYRVSADFIEEESRFSDVLVRAVNFHEAQFGTFV